MRLTTARYFTPSGRSIQAKGITPDIVVEPSKVESLLPKGAYLRESDLHGALKNKDKDTKKDEASDKETKDDKSDKKDISKDYQLLRAIDLLRGLSLYSHPTITTVNGDAESAAEKPVEESATEQTNP
jgi:carboxyl-terminal processing protease